MKENLVFRQLFDYETWTYTYLLADPETKEAALIDTVMERMERDHTLLQELGLKLKYLLDTHVHADHITGAAKLKKLTGAKTAVNKVAGVANADIQLEDGQELELGRFRIRALTTPGHTNTCMSFYVDGKVFTGDTLFVRDVGRTDFQQGSNEKMYESITKKIFTLPDETLIYPGHDYNGYTVSTVGEEKALNPKLQGGFADFKARMDAMNLGDPKRLHIAVPANLRGGEE
jgi:sulfur dioxygenase